MLAIKKIVLKFLSELQESVREKSIMLHFTEALVNHIAEVGYDPKMGARPLARKIDEIIKVPLSKSILFDNLEGKSLDIDWKDDALSITGVTPRITKEKQKALPQINGDGVIVLDQFKPKN